ncbi:hypothetical protein GGS23DRAFT_121279 [Durotheca rogersii]|uniref:uncharacterized protein n=1 Tax=Durotheca rogersii TaxID=419775 RepID=UPI00221F734A|nr:uncharacterized protein GGS23DRAFT_121279 [Durotheca rogersii]KAI5861975.1 hypothetical protein GGS23DRAFT_121279 [Durotheca rogersii]
MPCFPPQRDVDAQTRRASLLGPEHGRLAQLAGRRCDVVVVVVSHRTERDTRRSTAGRADKQERERNATRDPPSPTGPSYTRHLRRRGVPSRSVECVCIALYIDYPCECVFSIPMLVAARPSPHACVASRESSLVRRGGSDALLLICRRPAIVVCHGCPSSLYRPPYSKYTVGTSLPTRQISSCISGGWWSAQGFFFFPSPFPFGSRIGPYLPTSIAAALGQRNTVAQPSPLHLSF